MENNKTSINNFRKIPKLKLTSLFTPIEKCGRIRSLFPGAPHLYIKRDDHIGYVFGGNKVRKLEYVMADVLKEKSTSIVTTGSIQSNHARVTAMAAKRLGLNAVLVLNGEIPEPPRSNFLITTMLGTEVHMVETRQEREAKMEEIARALEKQGERVYKISLGCSDGIGACGLVEAMQEIHTQQREIGIEFDAIIVASSSGGTQAGLEVGKRLFDMNRLRIIGISPDDPSEAIKDSIANIANQICLKIEFDHKVALSEIDVDDRFIGEGYEIPSKESKEALEIFPTVEGILLDPVYTGKAAAALIAYCRRKIFKPSEHVLFWHTGGLMNLFS